MGKWSKAIAAVLGAAVTVALALGLNVEWATPEVIAGVGGVLTTILVAVFPANKTD